MSEVQSAAGPSPQAGDAGPSAGVFPSQALGTAPLERDRP
jgi:hypothetical protein